MSQERIDAVRAIYQDLNRGDAEAVAGRCADDFVLDMTGRVFNPDTSEGAEGWRRFLYGVHDAWESYRWDVEDTQVVGDAVVAMLHCTAQSREDSPPVDWHVAWIWAFDDGVAVSARFHRDPQDALESVGLA